MLILPNFLDFGKVLPKNLEKSQNIVSSPILNIRYYLIDLYFHRFVVNKDKDHY